MNTAHTSGILLHPTSLPSDFGIGDLGEQARTFLTQLQNANQKAWQMLPLTPPDPMGSPYASTSAFASNPALIDPLDLVERGWLTQKAVQDAQLPSTSRADIALATKNKNKLIKQAYKTWRKQNDRTQFNDFCKRHEDWLEDFVLFTALRDHHQQKSWTQWPIELIERRPDALKRAAKSLKKQMNVHRFAQWVFALQWTQLKSDAKQKGIELIGDIPIFVAMDSADVWANRDLFLLNEQGKPAVVAGVPPDYFSKTGQKWGNPLYDWDTMAKNNFAWWIDRIKRAMALVDCVRIDHFRGFEAYWEVPADAPTAETGKWVKAPGDALFGAIKKQLGDVPFIAEDLGLITEEVHQLRRNHNLPGMKVMHFAFAEYDTQPDHPFLPHTYPKACVAYAGTHDNNTTRGWFDALDEHQKHHVRVYLSSSNDDIVWRTIEQLLASNAQRVILTVQDIYECPASDRMNTPATTTGNWNWRMTSTQLQNNHPWQKLADLTKNHRPS